MPLLICCGLNADKAEQRAHVVSQLNISKFTQFNRAIYVLDNMTTQHYLGHASALDGGSIAARLRRGGRGWQDIHSEAFLALSQFHHCEASQVN